MDAFLDGLVTNGPPGGRRDRRDLLQHPGDPAPTAGAPRRNSSSSSNEAPGRAHHHLRYDAPITEAYTELRLRPLDSGGPALRVLHRRDRSRGPGPPLPRPPRQRRPPLRRARPARDGSWSRAAARSRPPRPSRTSRPELDPLERHDYLGPLAPRPVHARTIRAFAAALPRARATPTRHAGADRGGRPRDSCATSPAPPTSRPTPPRRWTTAAACARTSPTWSSPPAGWTACPRATSAATSTRPGERLGRPRRTPGWTSSSRAGAGSRSTPPTTPPRRRVRARGGRPRLRRRAADARRLQGRRRRAPLGEGDGRRVASDVSVTRGGRPTTL